MNKRLEAAADYFAKSKRVESCLRNVERLKSSSNIDRERANDAIIDLEEARRQEEEALSKYERIDTNYDQDLETRYKPQVAADTVTSIRDYARSQLFLEKQKLQMWQSIMSCCLY